VEARGGGAPRVQSYVIIIIIIFLVTPQGGMCEAARVQSYVLWFNSSVHKRVKDKPQKAKDKTN